MGWAYKPHTQESGHSSEPNALISIHAQATTHLIQMVKYHSHLFIYVVFVYYLYIQICTNTSKYIFYSFILNKYVSVALYVLYLLVYDNSSHFHKQEVTVITSATLCSMYLTYVKEIFIFHQAFEMP